VLPGHLDAVKEAAQAFPLLRGSPLKAFWLCTHLRQIEVSDRAAAVAQAMRRGLLE
jgi:hypothetical protein